MRAVQRDLFSRQADRILALSDRPSALFVTTDRKAMGVVHRLLDRGLRIPEEIAVVGCDDIPYAACAQVPLTTVAIPMRRMGELAAEILFDRLDGAGPSEPRQVLLLPELVIRFYEGAGMYIYFWKCRPPR